MRARRKMQQMKRMDKRTIVRRRLQLTMLLILGVLAVASPRFLHSLKWLNLERKPEEKKAAEAAAAAKQSSYDR